MLDFSGSVPSIQITSIERVTAAGEWLAGWEIDLPHVLRYEDLIKNPQENLRRLLSYADLDSSPAIVERMVAAGAIDSCERRAHRTTEHGLRSVGRYRRDMNDDTIGYCLEMGADLLSTLGYPV